MGHPKRKLSNHSFLGAMLVSGRVGFRQLEIYHGIFKQFSSWRGDIKKRTAVSCLFSRRFFYRFLFKASQVEREILWKIRVTFKVFKSWDIAIMQSWIFLTLPSKINSKFAGQLAPVIACLQPLIMYGYLKPSCFRESDKVVEILLPHIHWVK